MSLKINWWSNDILLLRFYIHKHSVTLHLFTNIFLCFLLKNYTSTSYMKVRVLVAQSCLTLCDPMDYSLPDSSAHGILQARILQWVAIPFSKRSYPLSLLHCGQIIYSLSHQGSPFKSKFHFKLTFCMTWGN